MRALIAGITGFNGSSLARALLNGGHDVKGLARDAGRVSVDVPIVIGDAVTGAGLDEAVRDVEVAYYFVHSFDPGDGSALERDLQAARNFGAAAREAGVDRIVFFTTPAPPPGVRSKYLENRIAVEGILFEAVPGSVALRCGMTVGPGSRALRPFVRLAERSRVIPMGPWRKNRVGALDYRDVGRYLIEAGLSDRAVGRSYDLPGAAIVDYERLVRMVADALGKRPRLVRLPFSSERTTVPIVAGVTGESREFVGALLSIAITDVVPDPSRLPDYADFPLRPLEQSMREAVQNWWDLPRYEQVPHGEASDAGKATGGRGDPVAHGR